MYYVPPAVLPRRVISAKLYCFGEINKKIIVVFFLLQALIIDNQDIVNYFQKM